MNDAMSQSIAAELDAMPAWADVSIGDSQALAAIELAIRHLSTDDEETILSAIRRYIEKRYEVDGRLNVSAMSKLFVLNRYIFNVPEFAPLNQPRFGAFIGIPAQDGLVNELWPWRIAADGELRLTGFFRGYTGETFQAMKEAEAFLSLYGLRQACGLG
jgi:hypothetical protein